MAVQITSLTPTPVIETIEKRQPIYAPVEPYDPTLDVLARSATDALTERASDTDDRFDSILCATLKELKSENPSSFTSLLQSCTSLTDSTSDRRTRSIKERNVVANTKDFATNVEAIDHESGKAMLGRSNANLPETRDISAKDTVAKRQDESSDALL